MTSPLSMMINTGVISPDVRVAIVQVIKDNIEDIEFYEFKPQGMVAGGFDYALIITAASTTINLTSLLWKIYEVIKQSRERKSDRKDPNINIVINPTINLQIGISPIVDDDFRNKMRVTIDNARETQQTREFYYEMEREVKESGHWRRIR